MRSPGPGSGIGQDARARGGAALRALLVQSWLGRREPPVMPLGLGLVAASLHGWEVAVFDPNLEDEPLAALERRMRDFQPDVTGISLRNIDTTSLSDRHSYLPAFREQVRIARRSAPGTLLVAGGAAASLFADALAACTPGLDMVFSGETEGLPAGAFPPETTVPGASGPPVVHGLPAALPGTPAYGLLDVPGYRKREDNLAVGVEVSRGCSRSCSYCSYPGISGNVERYRPERAVTGDLELLRGRWGVRRFFLVAPLLNADREKAHSLFTRIADEVPGISWEGYFSPVGLTREMALLAERAGCSGISLSPDAGSAAGMRRLGKGFGPEDVTRAVDAVRATSIRLSINLFPIAPGGSTMESLAAFARGSLWALRAGRRLSRLRFGAIRILPRTRLASGIRQQDLLEPRFWFGPGRSSPPLRVSLLTRLLERRLRR